MSRRAPGAAVVEVDQAINGRIITQGIVMEQGQTFHLGRQRDIHRILHGAMPPADFLRVLCRGVLGIMDNQVCLRQERNMPLFLMVHFQGS